METVNESNDNNSVNQYTVVSEPELVPAAPLHWRHIAAPLLALGLSILFWQVFSIGTLSRGWGPGLGIPVFTAAFFAAVLLMTGRPRRAEGLYLMGAALALSVSCALYAHPGFMVLNCFLILLLSAASAFALSGAARYGLGDLRSLPDTVRLSVLALFTRLDRPFRTLKALPVRGGRFLGIGAVTLLILGVVLALLSSADMVFGSFFQSIGEWLARQMPGIFLWRIFRALVLALLFASGLYFIQSPADPVPEKAHADKPVTAAPFLIPALALDVVYIIFCIVQLRYLFGGAETAAMAGGWAEYARTGFFQLSAVAAINLILCLSGTSARRFAVRGGRLLRNADGLLLLLTALILVSAAYRMRLYILAFGLSVLRLMTLWAMLVILVGLLAAGWKLFRPDFRFWPVCFAFALGSWCLLCLSGPAGRIADYNVDAYLDGRLEEVDVFYLEELSCDAAPALHRLAAGYDGRVDTDKYPWELDDPREQAAYVLRDMATSVRDGRACWSAMKYTFRFLDAAKE